MREKVSVQYEKCVKRVQKYGVFSCLFDNIYYLCFCIDQRSITETYTLGQMTYLILAILVMGYFLIATEKITNINKSAVAIFVGTVGWVLYICYGADYVGTMHSLEYNDFLQGMVPTSLSVKQFIAQNVFLKYVAKAAEIVLFLLATMSIVEILQNNGCFDFLLQLMRTRNSKRLLWMVSVVTFIISVNLDNLTTTVMMLTMMHSLLPGRRQRILYGSAIVISANCGGALTVIGDPTGLVLWNSGAVTATRFSMSLLAPCLVAWLVSVCWLGRNLPDRLQTESVALPYRGDDTNLNVWQRLLMLFVGIGGLWFIPTFHNITRLSPFLGALCVLSVLWIVNEVVNRKLLAAGDNIHRRVPRVLQYGVIQMMLFVMGVMLAMGVMTETGIARSIAAFLQADVGNVWVLGGLAGIVSMAVDGFLSAMTMFSLFPVADALSAQPDAALLVQNGLYWKVMAYATAMGGNVLCIGSMSGLAFMKMERVRVGWYFRNVGYKCLLGGLAGMAALWIVTSY